jgi:hypothetical protein
MEGAIKAMWLTHLKTVAALLAVTVSAPQALADKPPEKLPKAAKLDLTPESWPGLHALIGPQDQEWRHLKVNWLTDVVAARKKAAAEDKPVVFLYTGGAGYNDPLGVC